MSAGAPRRVLLIGGTSEIGLAIVRRLAQDTPVQPVLLGRDAARLAVSLASLGGESVGETTSSMPTPSTRTRRSSTARSSVPAGSTS